MKAKIYVVGVSLEEQYVVQVRATSEERAEAAAKRLVLSRNVDPDNQEIDILDVYESNDDEDED